MSSEKNNKPAKLHWLVRPNTIKILWVVGILTLALTVYAGTTIHPHVYFGIEGSFAFYGWYGFATCVAMVVGAKIIGVFLKRKDTYYDR